MHTRARTVCVLCCVRGCAFFFAAGLWLFGVFWISLFLSLFFFILDSTFFRPSQILEEREEWSPSEIGGERGKEERVERIRKQGFGGIEKRENRLCCGASWRFDE